VYQAKLGDEVDVEADGDSKTGVSQAIKVEKRNFSDLKNMACLQDICSMLVTVKLRTLEPAEANKICKR
jgi:hypothetical protein